MPLATVCFARLPSAMTRLLLIVLMLVLPVQWTWAAAASVCSHEETVESTHFGHHEHAHQGPSATDDAVDDGQAGSLAAHPDCGVCHGMSSAFVPVFEGTPKPWTSRSFYALYASAVPDRFIETLLRPPLTLVS